jgi:hypothetical protein
VAARVKVAKALATVITRMTAPEAGEVGGRDETARLRARNLPSAPGFAGDSGG